MAKPMRRASMRRAMRPLEWRDGRNHARGLKTSARIDTTIQTVICVLPNFLMSGFDLTQPHPLETSHTELIAFLWRNSSCPTNIFWSPWT